MSVRKATRRSIRELFPLVRMRDGGVEENMTSVSRQVGMSRIMGKEIKHGESQ